VIEAVYLYKKRSSEKLLLKIIGKIADIFDD